MDKVIVTNDVFTTIEEEEGNYFYCIYWHRFEDIMDFIRKFKEITESIKFCNIRFESLQKIYKSEELPIVHELTILVISEKRKVTVPLSYINTTYRLKDTLMLQYIAISRDTGKIYILRLPDEGSY